MLLIITSTSDELFSSANIDDLERPWTPEIRVLVIFGDFQLGRTLQKWIATKWLEMDQDNLRKGTATVVASRVLW